MIRALGISLSLVAWPALAGDLPSGKTATLQEVLTDTVAGESWLRFRFVAEDLTRATDYATTADDMLHLCERRALPYIAELEIDGDVIVVSLADRPTVFGVADPDAVQVFEAFRIAQDGCVWEGL